MSGLIAKIMPAILSWIATWIWGKVSDAVKERLAEEQVKKNVKAVMEKYEAIILKYDELHDAGQLTEDKKDELRKEKIKLEEDLFNHIQH